jgi:hypothetical protein
VFAASERRHGQSHGTEVFQIIFRKEQMVRRHFTRHCPVGFFGSSYGGQAFFGGDVAEMQTHILQWSNQPKQALDRLKFHARVMRLEKSGYVVAVCGFQLFDRFLQLKVVFRVDSHGNVKLRSESEGFFEGVVSVDA